MNPASQTENHPVILWQICDGKRGHLGQSTGLIEALRRRAPLALYQVTAASPGQSLASCLTGKTPWAGALPAPRVAVGAGHATHAALLAVGRVYRARTVVLMRPSLPLGWFDYCLVPAHDEPPARDNVIVTTGAVNAMQATRDHSPEHGLILVGGPSRHYQVDTPALLARLRQLLARASPRYWTLSNSPRTPAQLRRELAGLQSARVEVVSWNNCGPGWLAGALARAGDVWVTEDSVSMIYEALSCGCRVGLLPLPRNAATRLHRATDRLLEDGFVCAYNDRDTGAALHAPPRVLAEADRCAALLLEQGLLAQTPGAGNMPLTVLQTLPALETGGVERGALDLAAELARRGHRSLVMSAGGPLTAELSAGGSRHYTWPVGKKSPFTLLLAFRLRRFLSEEKVDILHARSRLPAWVSYLAWHNMPAGRRPVFITTVHGRYRVGHYSAVMTRGQKVIAVSRYIHDYIMTNYPWVDPGKVSIIHRGVDPKRFPGGYRPSPGWLARWRRDWPQLQGKALVTLPGRITRWKGHRDFIDVIGRLKQAGTPVHGLVAGPAAPRRQKFFKELMRTATARGLDRDLSFLGRRDDLREVLGLSDVVLSLANIPEAFGRTALEALSLGRPVVAYAHGGAREVLEALQPDGLVEPGNTVAAAGKIRDFLKTRPHIAPNRCFTLERMLDSTLALYEQARG